MTPFTALYRKEFREHRTSFFIMLGCLALCLLLPLCFGGEIREGTLIPYIYLYGFYVTAIAAMSYAKEEENKTSRFLRSLPVASGTILLAKLAWLGTAMLVLIVPAGLAIYVPFFWTHGIGSILASDRTSPLWLPAFMFGVSLFSLISWGYFWTTRYPSKLFATLLSYCCTFICCLVSGWFVLDIATRYYDGKMDYRATALMGIGILLLSLPFAVLGLWRAARFYDRAEPESKPGAFLNSERKDNDRRVRLVTRFFPKDRWTPFQALLWQAICQSRDILFLGLGTAIAFALWQVFLSERFFAIMNGSDPEVVDWQWFMLILGLGIIIVGFLVAFGLGSSIFAQDQERGMYRALGHRGVPARLVWWSRVLPFLAVILIPVPFIFRMLSASLGTPVGERAPLVYAGMAFCTFLYFAPFCFGAFYSLIFRNVLTSMLSTFGTWLLYIWGMTLGGQICTKEFGIASHPGWFAIPVVIPLLFLVASRLMCNSWLREEPWSRRWPVPVTVLAAFALYAFGPLTVYGCFALGEYIFTGRFT